MKKVLLVGPVLSRSGYGEMARFALRSLLTEPSIDLYIHNLNWGKSGWIWRDDDERKLIDSLLQKTVFYNQQGGKYDSSIQVTIPNEWKRLTPHDVGYTAGIETDKVAPHWLLKGNEMQKIITISKHSKDTYISTKYDGTNSDTGEPVLGYKLETPIDVVGFPVRNLESEELTLNLRHDFNFLCVAQLGPRKNIDAVLNNFIDEFKNEDVGLLFKIHAANDSVMDFHHIRQRFAQIKQTAEKEGWACSINILHGNLSDEQMQGLYNHPKVKAMISLTHGEGFGLPIYEAASNNLPVIATDWSGHLDFLSAKTPLNSKKFKGGKTKGKLSTSKKMFAPVKYELKQIEQNAVWDGVLHADSKWAFVDDADARKKMRDVYKNYDKWLEKAEQLSQTFLGEEHYYSEFIKATGIEIEDTNEEEFIL